MISVTRDFVFDAAHFLYDYEGPCADMHGHTYKGNVTVRRDNRRLHEDMVMDFKELSKLIQERVVDQFDHKVINEIVNYNPTAENIAMNIAMMMMNNLPRSISLGEVKLWETPDSHATWSR